MNRIYFVIAALLALTFASDWAIAKEECGKSVAQGQEYGWCVEKNQGPDVMYVLHGGGGSEASAFENSEKTKNEWKEMGFDYPSVISFSFGPGWLLSDIATAERPALLDLVTKEILPSLEAKIGGVKGKRLLYGWSMGGYNGALLALRLPNHFDRAALLCPAMFSISPFDGTEKIEQFLASNPVVLREHFLGNFEWAREEFKNEEGWQRHSPLALAAKAKDLKTSFFTSCSRGDELGFFPGAESFAAELAKKTESRWVDIKEGGHCAQSAESESGLIKFLGGK